MSSKWWKRLYRDLDTFKLQLVYSVCILSYTAAEECGGNYTQESGTIDFTPGESYYKHIEYCVWHVQLPDSGSRIVVNVTDFNLDYSCDNGNLEASIYLYRPEIFDGIWQLEAHQCYKAAEATRVCVLHAYIASCFQLYLISCANLKWWLNNHATLSKLTFVLMMLSRFLVEIKFFKHLYHF